MQRSMRAALLTVAALGTTFSALAIEPEESARAAFPLPPPTATATLPLPPTASAPAPSTTAPIAPEPSSAPAASAYPTDPYDYPPVASAPPRAGSTEIPELDSQRKRDQKIHDDWMLSIEGATHAPIDVGIFGGVETPIGLRLFGGYGWVPSAYLNFVTNAIVLSSGADPATSALVKDGFEGGNAWRIQAGIRPFKKIGVYFDAGYSRVTLRGSLDASELASVPELGLAGVYRVQTTIDMWLLELGYQAEIAGRVVLAAGVGMMGTFGANTSVTADSGSSIGAPSAAVIDNVDKQIEKHGYLPTLSLRLGFDLI